jgi:hypothetical protein
MFDVTIWGTVAQWVGALLSGAAVLLALYLVQRDRLRDEREQAMKVVCVARTTVHRDPHGHGKDFRAVFNLHNTSTEPITDPRVRLEFRDTDEARDIVEHLDTGTDREIPIKATLDDWFLARNLDVDGDEVEDDVIRDEVGPGERATLVEDIELPLDCVVVDFHFADARGVRWARTYQGALRRVAEAPSGHRVWRLWNRAAERTTHVPAVAERRPH